MRPFMRPAGSGLLGEEWSGRGWRGVGQVDEMGIIGKMHVEDLFVQKISGSFK